MSEYIERRLIGVSQHQPSTLDQARSKQVVLQELSGMVEVTDGEMLRHWARMRSHALREDEPHPVAHLLA